MSNFILKPGYVRFDGQKFVTDDTVEIIGPAGPPGPPGPPGANLTLSGDLSGNNTYQKVIGIQGNPISSTPPSTGQFLGWNGSKWLPTSIPAGFTAGGDLSGTSTNQIVSYLQGNTLTLSSISNNQIIGVSSGIIKNITIGGDISASSGIGSISVIKIQGISVSSVTPTNNQVLQYNSSSSSYVPTSLTGPTAGPIRIYGVAQSVNTTTSVSPVTVGYFEFNPSLYPTSGLTITFEAIIQVASTADTCILTLQDDSDAVQILQFTSSSTSPDYHTQSITVSSSATTNTIANSLKRYYISIQRSGGVSTDAVTVHNAYFSIVS